MLRILLRIQKCTRIQPKCRTLPHLRSLYSRYSLMALGRLSLSRAPCSTRGRPICCRITRRHRSIRGSGSAATNKQIWMYWRTYSTKNLSSINLSNINLFYKLSPSKANIKKSLVSTDPLQDVAIPQHCLQFDEEIRTPEAAPPPPGSHFFHHYD